MARLIFAIAVCLYLGAEGMQGVAAPHGRHGRRSEIKRSPDGRAVENHRERPAKALRRRERRMRHGLEKIKVLLQESAVKRRHRKKQKHAVAKVSSSTAKPKRSGVSLLGRRGEAISNRSRSNRSGSRLIDQLDVNLDTIEFNLEDKPHKKTQFKNLATMKDDNALSEWCHKFAYEVDFDHAAYKFSNATNSDETSTEGRTGYYHLHTPKVAGVSFGEDLAGALPAGVTVDSHEGCFDDNKKTLHGVVMMVRAPRAHVMSQYSFCATSPDAGPSHMHELMPDSFDDWIGNWSLLKEQSKEYGEFTVGPKTAYNDPWCFSTLPYACYSPIDLQTQRLTCEAGKAYDYPEEQDLSRAVSNMASTFFVGIVEAYQESICLLHAKLNDKLPKWCDCENEKEWNKAPVHQDDHGASHDATDDVSDEVLSMVDSMTENDRSLYNQALDRFMMEIDAAEKKFKTTIVCEGNFDTN